MKKKLLIILLNGWMAACFISATHCQKTSEPKSMAEQSPDSPSKKDKESRSSGRKGSGNGAGKIVSVKAQTAQTAELPRIVELVSVLEGRKQAQVYARVAGKISFIGPSEGQHVKEGEILFRVDRSDPGESFLATPVVSPITGWVSRWLVSSLGTQVSAQESVVIIVDDESLKSQIQLPTKEWLLVSEKTPIKVKVGSEERTALVKGISRSADIASSRGTITVEINNENHQWKAGMTANISLHLDNKPRLILPATALSLTDQGSFVFTIAEGKAKRQRVQFDVVDNDRVEITEGLASGEQVIIQGVNQVGNGLAVKVIEEPKNEHH